MSLLNKELESLIRIDDTLQLVELTTMNVEDLLSDAKRVLSLNHDVGVATSNKYIDTLARGIAKGIEMPPVAVRKVGDNIHEIIDGHHRIVATAKAGNKTIKVLRVEFKGNS